MSHHPGWSGQLPPIRLEPAVRSRLHGLAVRGLRPSLEEAPAQYVTDHLTQVLQVVVVYRNGIDGETTFPNARGTHYEQGERWS